MGKQGRTLPQTNIATDSNNGHGIDFQGLLLLVPGKVLPFHCMGKGGQAQSLKSAEAPKRQSAKWHRSAKASLSVKASKRHMQRSAKVVRSAGT